MVVSFSHFCHAFSSIYATTSGERAEEMVEIGKRGKNLHTKIIIHLYILTSIISRKRAVIKHKVLLDSITTAPVECGMWEGGTTTIVVDGKLGIFFCVLRSRFREF